MLKLKMMLCVMTLPAGRRRLHIKAVCQSVREGSLPPAWIMQPPPDWQSTAELGLFHPQREYDHYAKTTWKEPRSILMSSADRVAHIEATHAIIVSRTASSGVGVAQCNKTVIHLRMFAGFVLTTFSAPPQILAASTVFFCPIPETKK